MAAKALLELVPDGQRHHAPSGFFVTPATGEVWSAAGRPVGSRNRDGYVRIIVRVGGGSCSTWYAHRLVWEAVHGPIPDRMEVDHLDGNAANNALGNLELVTGSENRRRQRERSLARWGCASPGCKLTDAEAKAVLDTRETVPATVWATRLSVDPSVIRSIRQGRVWKHLPRGPKRTRSTKRG